MIEKYKLFSNTLFTLFWVLTCYGFVVQFLPIPESVITILLIICDLSLLILGLATLRNKADIVIILSFFAISFTSTVIVNRLGFITYFNGIRDFFGLLFVIPVLRWFFDSKYKEQFIASVEKQLKFWLYLQAFCATIQFFVFDTFDDVGGSMGDGASGFLSMFLYLVSFYFVRKNWDSDHYFRSLKENLRYVILLYPSFLNETKASFLYILLYFVLLMKYDKTLLLKMIYIVPLSVAGLVLLFNVYCSITNQDPSEVFSIDFLEQYMVAGDVDLDFTIEMAQKLQDGDFDDSLESEWWTVDVPRYAKFAIVVPIMGSYPGGYLFGLGVGHFKGSRLLGTTDFAKEYQWAIQSSRVWAFTVFMQLGLLGIVWFLAFIAYIFRGNLYGPMAKRVQLFLMACVFVIFFYNETFRLPNLCMMMFFILFVIHSPSAGNHENIEARQKEKLLLD